MYEELVKRLRDISNSDSKIKSNYIGLTMLQAADAIEELSRQRDRAYSRLCEWCDVCPVDRRNLEDCEIAMIGQEYTSPDWETCQPEPLKNRRL